MPGVVTYRLYIAGNSPNSSKAVANFAKLCRQHLSESHRVEIVDVLCDPKRALADGVLITPQLLKISPKPKVTILGDLADLDVVRNALGLNPTESPGHA